MRYTREQLMCKTHAELCEITAQLGGAAPASGRFRTKAQGAQRILVLQRTCVGVKQRRRTVRRLLRRVRTLPRSMRPAARERVLRRA